MVDGTKEFCNITCGNITAKLAQIGKKYEIGPPFTVPLEEDAEPGTTSYRNIFLYNLVSATEQISLYLIEY
jgi:CheY-specific phosphatase CheX